MSNLLQLKPIQAPGTPFFEDCFTGEGELQTIKKSIGIAVQQFFFDEVLRVAKDIVEALYNVEKPGNNIMMMSIKIHTPECLAYVIPRVVKDFQRSLNHGEMLEVGFIISQQMAGNIEFYKDATNKVGHLIGEARSAGLKRELVESSIIENMSELLDTLRRK